MFEFLFGYALGEDAARARRRDCCCCHCPEQEPSPPKPARPSFTERIHRSWPFVIAALLVFAAVAYDWTAAEPLPVGALAWLGMVAFGVAAFIATIPPRRSSDPSP